MMLAMFMALPAQALEFVELDLGNGLRHFNNYCVNCHYHDGTGSAVAKKAFRIELPVLLTRKNATPKQYFKRIMYGGPHMAPMDWELTARDVWDIVYALPLIRQHRPSSWQKQHFRQWVEK